MHTHDCCTTHGMCTHTAPALHLSIEEMMSPLLIPANQAGLPGSTARAQLHLVATSLNALSTVLFATLKIG